MGREGGLMRGGQGGGGHMTLSGPVVGVPRGRIRTDFPPADAVGSTWRGVVRAVNTKPRESDRCNRRHGRDEKQYECGEVRKGEVGEEGWCLPSSMS